MAGLNPEIDEVRYEPSPDGDGYALVRFGGENGRKVIFEHRPANR